MKLPKLEADSRKADRDIDRKILSVTLVLKLMRKAFLNSIQITVYNNNQKAIQTMNSEADFKRFLNYKDSQRANYGRKRNIMIN